MEILHSLEKKPNAISDNILPCWNSDCNTLYLRSYGSLRTEGDASSKTTSWKFDQRTKWGAVCLSHFHVKKSGKGGGYINQLSRLVSHSFFSPEPYLYRQSKVCTATKSIAWYFTVQPVPWRHCIRNVIGKGENSAPSGVKFSFIAVPYCSRSIILFKD